MKIIFFFVLALLCSCNSNNGDVLSDGYMNANQKFIKAQWIKMSYYANDQPDSLTILVPILEEKSKNEPAVFQAMVNQFKALNYFKDNQFELAHNEHKNALLRLKNAQVDSLSVISTFGIGTYYKRTGNYSKAISYYLKAAKYYENQKKNQRLEFAFVGIGEVYSMKGDFENAKKYLLKGVVSLSKDKKSTSYLIASHTLANFYGMNGDFESALKIDKEGIAIADSLQSESMKTKFLNNKANCYLYSGQLDSAKIYLDKSMKIDLKLKNQMHIADSYANYAQLFLMKNDLQEAKWNIEKAIDLQSKADLKPDLGNSLEILKNIYLQQNDLNLVIDTQNRLFANYQKIISERKEAALVEYNIIYKTQEKEKLILQQQDEVRQKNILLIAGFVSVVLLSFVGFLFYKQQLLKNKQQEQAFLLQAAMLQVETQTKLYEQRLSIARDLHDNIGSQLSFIISSIENIKFGFKVDNDLLTNKLACIGVFAKAAIQELRDTIWAMNTDTFSMDDLRLRIYNFIKKAENVHEQTDFKISIGDDLDEKIFDSLQGINLYRIVQEAVNNALKHAEATEITLNMFRDNDQIKLEIADNGKGFDLKAENMGNGLNNIKNRCAEINATLEIETAESGTRIVIFFR